MLQQRHGMLFSAPAAGHVMIFALTFELVFLPFLSANDFSEAPPSSRDIQSHWKPLDEKLANFLNDVSGIETLREAYDNATSRGDITFDPVDGSQLVKEVSSSLAELFAKKVEALRASVEHAEKIAEDYKWDHDLKVVDYLNARELNDTIDPFANDDLLGQIVNLENSSIHIPIDIFKGNVDILNTIAWTSGLDEVWKKNKDRDPSLVWQYFGSRTGVLRSYPGTKWKNKTVVDLYDARRTQWYTQGVSSPKDMLILIERSGSSHGQALELMRHSVRSILDTLGENDFVNIAHFSDKADFAGCFHTFVQATSRNKNKLKSFLHNIAAQQVANYALGFEFAFQQFANFSDCGNECEGSNCNRIIMLFTDGTSDVPVDVFQKFNPDKKIRVFSYAVGPIMAGSKSSPTKEIGCSNRGFFYAIPALGAIRATVQGYLSILAPSLAVASRADKISWTSPLQDKLNVGLVLAVTMPVFQKANISSNLTQEVLGMMGVDITLKELNDKIPSDRLGPNGYAFGINYNGIVIFHPELKKFVPDLMDPVIDFADIEEETPLREQIRKDMIDQVTSSVEIQDFITDEDMKHVDKRTQTYHYAPIPGTNFSLAVVIPDYVKYYISSKASVDLEEGLSLLLKNRSQILFDAMTICKFPEPENETLEPLPVLEQFLEALLSNISECDPEAVQKLLFDVKITSALEKKWVGSDHSEDQKQDLNDLQLNDTFDDTEAHVTNDSINNRVERSMAQSDEGINARFVTTGDAFVRIYPQSDYEDEDEQENLRKFIERLHHRSFDNDVWLFTSYPEEVGLNQSASMIFATKAVSLKTNNYKAATIGVQLTLTKFHDLLFNHDSSECGSSTSGSFCYILDDGGFILSANTDDFEFTVGEFFGVTEGEVMKALIDNNFYESHADTNYLAICEITTIKGAGIRIVPPFIFEILSLNWWTKVTTWSYLSLVNLYSWVFAAEVPTMAPIIETEDTPCTKSSYMYHFGDSDSLSGEAGCDNCTRKFTATRLQSTNLLMVSVDGESCNCEDLNITFPHSTEIDDEPPEEENTEEESSANKNCIASVRYRRRPRCYDKNPNEPDSYCSSTSILVSSNYPIMLLVSVVLTKLLLLPSGSC